jgi:hypothetical protein
MEVERKGGLMQWLMARDKSKEWETTVGAGAE